MASNDAFNNTRSFRIPPPSSSPQPNQPTAVLARRAPTGHYLRQPREETESPDQDLSNYQIHVHPDAGAESAEVRVEALTVYGLNNGTVLPPLSPAHESVNGNWDQFIFGPNGGGCGLEGKEYRPLTRKISVSAAVLVPYRILIFFRMVVLVIYLAWRIRNKNEDAVWLWGMSVTCEIWFTVSWLLEQLPKLSPVKRTAELTVLKDKFETAAGGKSDLPGIDVFIVTADPDREPPLVNANTILSVLAADYPVEKLACYLSDDAGSLLTFETVAETASFAAVWVPFCRKHDIEPRGPENYFSLKDPYRRNKMRPDFVRDRRRVKREYDEFKVRINALPAAIRRRSDAHNAREESKALERQRELFGDEPLGRPAIPRATWMIDGSQWPGIWICPSPQHTQGDHTAIVQVMLKSPSNVSTLGSNEGGGVLDLAGVDVRLPMLVYVAREKRPGYEDNRKAGAMNALLRASAVISNGAFLLDLDFGNYVHNSGAFREGMCYMMDRGGQTISFAQFPRHFEGVDASDHYSNHTNEFFDVNMRALDGIQGPVYLGTGCLFRRMALYGFDPPLAPERDSGCCFGRNAKPSAEEREALRGEEAEIRATYRKRFGNSTALIDSMEKAEFESRPLADDPGMKYGRPAGALAGPRRAVMPAMVAEAVSVVACSYEDKTEWGDHVGWIYNTVTEDIVTGYRMHERGWRSVYCATVRDAFRSTAPIDLTDRLHRILRLATGAVEMFFSRNNALFVTPGMKALQRVAYLNASAYPLASVFLTVYCFLPALCLFSGQFIVRTLSSAFLAFVLVLTVTLCVVAALEIKWSGVLLVDWWRNEQLWVMGGTSAHLAALVVGLLKGVTGVNLLSKRVKKSGGAAADGYAELDMVKWTSMMIPPITIMMVNLVAVAVGLSRTIYISSPEWSKFLGGLVFSCWVLVHLSPFAKGLMGRKKTPTIIFVWSGLIAITISLLWVSIRSPSVEQQIGGSITFP